MCPEDAVNTGDDPLAQFARIVYDQMNIEPRRMNVAIELAKQHLADIRRALVKEGLRKEEETESTVNNQKASCTLIRYPVGAPVERVHDHRPEAIGFLEPMNRGAQTARGGLATVLEYVGAVAARENRRG